MQKTWWNTVKAYLKYLKTKISCDDLMMLCIAMWCSRPNSWQRDWNSSCQSASDPERWDERSWNGAGSSTASQQDSSTNSGLWSLKAFNEDILKESKEMSKIVQDCPRLSKHLSSVVNGWGTVNAAKSSPLCPSKPVSLAKISISWPGPQEWPSGSIGETQLSLSDATRSG